jgi:Skp family chaperone for outer membrane proteins
MVGQRILSLDNNFKKKVLYFLKQNVMRKQFLILFLATIVSNTIYGQAKGSKVGYIDMEYILENTKSYKEASAQLEEKAQKWKLDIETKKAEVKKLKDALKAETPLLTNELIKEREAEIDFLEKEMLDYQQKRFGANGDLMIQKAGLAKPIQDQVFTAIQDIAVAKKYDYIFDKSSDLTMLFAAKRLDISDQVLRVLNRTEKREQLSKKELKAQQEKEAKEDNASDTSDVSNERQATLEARKAKLVQAQEDKKAAYEAKKKEMDERRKQILADRAALKSGTVSANTTTEVVKTGATTGTAATDPAEEARKNAILEAVKKEAEANRNKQIEERNKTLEERQKILEERKKALEEKRKKTLEDRAAAKKAIEEKVTK